MCTLIAALFLGRWSFQIQRFSWFNILACFFFSSKYLWYVAAYDPLILNWHAWYVECLVYTGWFVVNFKLWIILDMIRITIIVTQSQTSHFAIQSELLINRLSSSNKQVSPIYTYFQLQAFFSITMHLLVWGANFNVLLGPKADAEYQYSIDLNSILSM